MTLANTPIVNSYVGNNSSNNFPFNFECFEATDLVVVITSPANITYTTIYGIDYTVSGLNVAGGPPSTGSITLVNAGQAWLTGGNLTTGWAITLTRSVPLAQNFSIRNQGDFFPETLEEMADYLMACIQQVQALIVNPIIPSNTAGITINANFITTLPGGGLIVTTPNGLHTYLIGVANDGALSATQLT